MRKSILSVALVFVSIWVVLAADSTAVRLTERLGAFGVVTVSAAAVASLLILYFDWRRGLRRRILDESDDRRHLERIA